MNLSKLTNIVFDAINSRKDKTNKITLLAMAINGTYVEDTTYVDDKILWMYKKDEDDFGVHYDSMSEIVKNANKYEFESIDLLLTEKQASKFSILSGLVGVLIVDDTMLSDYIGHLLAYGADVTDVTYVVAFSINELDNNTKFTYNGVEYTLLPTNEDSTATAPVFASIDLVGESFNISLFLLGDNIIVNDNEENILYSPFGLLFTQEQYSKTQFSILFSEQFLEEENTTNEQASNEVILELLMNKEVLVDTPFVLPENSEWVLNVSGFVYTFLAGTITSFTITYDGVDYVYDSTNIQITLPSDNTGN